MKLHPLSHSRVIAFTLIELLVVIAIIAILMALLFPAIGIVKEQARKAEARAAVAQIAAAVKQYYTEYGKYPIGSQTPPADTDVTYGDAANGNEGLFNILRNIGTGGAPNQYNPRAMVMFEGKGATNPEAPRSGFVATAAGSNLVGAYMDPWGKQYQIILDADYNNVVTVPHTDFAAPNAPKTGCAVFSMGKDGAVGGKDEKPAFPGVYRSGSKVSDDIITWQ